MFCILFLAHGESNADHEQEIKVGVYNFEPLVFIDNQGNAKGFFVDILEYIAAKEFWDIHYITGSWDQCINRLENGSIDLLAGFGYSEKNAKEFDFTKEFLFLDWGLVYKHKGSKISTIFDLNDQKVSVLKSSIYTEGFKHLLDQFGIQCQFIEKQEYTQVFDAIDTKEADAGISAQIFGMLMEKNYDIERTQIFFSPIKIGFAVKTKKNTNLLNTLDKHIIRLKSDTDSVYYHNLDKWMGFYSSQEIPKWFIIVLYIIGLLLVFFFFVNFFLKKQVISKTKELLKVNSDLEITNQKLKEVEKRFNQLVENIDEVFWIGTKDFEKVIYISPGYEKVWGKTCESLYKDPMSWFKSIVQSDRIKVLRAIKKSIFFKDAQDKSNQKIFSVEYRITRPGGQIHWIMSRAFPIRNEDGEIYRIIGIASDITERKLVEQALKASEEKIRKIIESSPIGVRIAKEGKLVYVNQAFVSIYGYDNAKELIGMDLEQLIAPEDRELVRSRHQRRLSGEDVPMHYEIRALRKSGDIFTANVWVTLIDYEGVPSVLGFITDISAEKRLLAQLQQTQKMEAIGTLAGGIAHDFNNILTSIIGYTELVLDNTQNGSSIQNNLKEVLKAGVRAKELIMQILTFSRQTDHAFKPVKIKVIAKEVMKLLRATLPTTIEIEHNIESDSLILGNQTQIHQVLMNLCTNAGYAMQEKGGVLSVNLTDVFIDSDLAMKYSSINPGTYINLTVSDTGYGIAPNIIGRIFDPFFTTKVLGEGTGMGLSVVHGIVKDHGGVISVYSEPTKGSVFKVFFPIITEIPQNNQEGFLNNNIPKGNESILFVDDEASIVKFTNKMLIALGYNVVATTSSVEALEIFRKDPKRFDLVITDMTMPGIRGDELAKHIIEINPNIPVILCTGFSSVIDEKKATEMGIHAFLSKPLLKSEIAQTIRKVLDNR